LGSAGLVKTGSEFEINAQAAVSVLNSVGTDPARRAETLTV